MFFKLLKYTLLVLLVSALSAFAYVLFAQALFDPNQLPENYGNTNVELYSDNEEKRPLLVYFGGSEGGNSMAKTQYTKEREIYTDSGYAMLAVGYFAMPGLPQELDRISLNAIYEQIQIARNSPGVDPSCVAVMGGSKGAELALALASRYPDINGAVALAGSHVSFNSIAVASDGRTGSFAFDDKSIPYVTVPVKAIPYLLLGDFRKVHEIALSNASAEVLTNASFAVEKIQGPIMLVSGEKDQVWPSTEMSEQVVSRLKSNNFAFPFEHITVPNGNHFQPQADYHKEVIAFLDKHFKPHCASVNTAQRQI